MGILDRLRKSKIEDASEDKESARERKLRDEVEAMRSNQAEMDSAKKEQPTEHAEELERIQQIETESRIVWIKLKNKMLSDDEAAKIIDDNNFKIRKIQELIAKKDKDAARKTAKS